MAFPDSRVCLYGWLTIDVVDAGKEVICLPSLV